MSHHSPVVRFTPLAPRPEWEGHLVSEYEKMLNTFEWKKCSREVKERDGWKCRGCQRSLDLEVHHLKYTSRYPWLEPRENLLTLCSICHHAREQDRIGGEIAPEVKGLLSDLLEGKKVPSPNPNKLAAQLQWAEEVHYRNR